MSAIELSCGFLMDAWADTCPMFPLLRDCAVRFQSFMRSCLARAKVGPAAERNQEGEGEKKKSSQQPLTLDDVKLFYMVKHVADDKVIG